MLSSVSSDSFTGFLFYFIIVQPILSWILKPKRFSRQRALYYAIAFLVCLSSLTMFLKIKEREANFYEVLQIRRDSSSSEIKRAYRSQSVAIHPDKNPSENAAEEFGRLQTANEVLLDSEKRQVYDLFGEAAAMNNSKETPEQATMSHLIQMCMYYIMWGTMSYVMTLGSAIGNGRSWIFIGIVSLFLLELNLKFAKNVELPLAIFPRLTPFELIALIKSIFPAFLHACRAIGGYLHVDMSRQTFMLSIELLKTNRDILLGMRQLQGNLMSLGKRDASKIAKAQQACLSSSSKRCKLDKVQQENKPDAADVPNELKQPTPEIQASSKFKIPSFVWFLFIYFGVNYFLKS